MRYTIYKDGIPVHTSMTEFKNPEYLLQVLINQYWTPIHIVQDYLKNPELFTVLPVDDPILPPVFISIPDIPIKKKRANKTSTPVKNKQEEI